MSAVHHVLYTNAPARDGAGGFRPLFPRAISGVDWPAGDRDRLVRWLAALAPEGDDLATAFAPFRLGRRPHAVLARVDPGFARDEHGRGGGVLAHGLVAPLDETCPPGDFGTALWRLADDVRAAAAPSAHAPGDRVDAYLAACASHPELSHRVVDPAAALGPEEGVAARFLAVASGELPPGGDGTVAFPEAAPADLAPAILLAASALPPRLRLAARWAVGVRGGDVGFVARAAPAARAVPEAGVAAAFHRWLREAVAARRYDRVVAVADDWHVRSWPQLLASVTGTGV